MRDSFSACPHCMSTDVADGMCRSCWRAAEHHYCYQCGTCLFEEPAEGGVCGLCRWADATLGRLPAPAPDIYERTAHELRLHGIVSLPPVVP